MMTWRGNLCSLGKKALQGLINQSICCYTAEQQRAIQEKNSLAISWGGLGTATPGISGVLVVRAETSASTSGGEGKGGEGWGWFGGAGWPWNWKFSDFKMESMTFVDTSRRDTFWRHPCHFQSGVSLMVIRSRWTFGVWLAGPGGDEFLLVV